MRTTPITRNHQRRRARRSIAAVALILAGTAAVPTLAAAIPPPGGGDITNTPRPRVAASCVYDDKWYSHGSEVYQGGKWKKCKDGSWV